jgi:hypothetical protein
MLEVICVWITSRSMVFSHHSKEDVMTQYLKERFMITLFSDLKSAMRFYRVNEKLRLETNL